MASAPDAPARPSSRLVRIEGDRGPSLAERLSVEIGRLSHGTLIHRLRLRGRFPAQLLGRPVDPFPGDPARGRAILAAREHGRGPLGNPPAQWTADTHGFTWLRDVAAADPHGLRAQVEPVLRPWLARFGHFDPLAWRPDVLGQRTLAFVLHAPALLATSDLVHRSALLGALARGTRHLAGTLGQAPEGLPRLHAGAGAIAGALLVPHAEGDLARVERAFGRALDAFVAADGGVASRAPIDMLETLELLVTLAACYAARARPQPGAQRAARARLAPAISGLAHADGGLAAFHGGVGAPAARVRRALLLAEARDRPPATPAGFVRLDAGGAVVLLDAGPPPESRLSHGAHAGTLAFELSHGDRPLIVNCGGARGGWRAPPPDIAPLLRTTAAHSTLVVADTNSTRLRDDGRLGAGVVEVVATREDHPMGAIVEARHDGFARRHGVIHVRRLFLSRDGRDLRGEDRLEAAARRRPPAAPFDIRFHLAPGVTAEIDAGGALIRHAAGQWRFAARGAALAIEDSLAFTAAGRVERTRQLVLTGEGLASVAWALRALD
jgi:uncharacterized heparinase superfamily protein